LVGRGAELGKAQPVWSNVLTPSGWRKIGELRVGDEIINSSGNISNVLGIFPQGKKKINKVSFSDGTHTYCCDEHLWFTTTYNDKRFNKVGSVKNTKEIKETLYRGNRHNHSIPYNSAIADFNSKSELPIDSYIMGVLLGDGSFRVGKYRIGLSTTDEEIIDYVNSHIEKAFVKNGKSKCDYRLHSVKYANIIKQYGLLGRYSHEKYIPKEYLLSNISSRRSLLRGLMDTDGSPHTNNGSTCEYSTTSEQLARDVEFLVRSLGGRCSTKQRYTSFTYKGVKKQGRKSYRLTISFTDFNPFQINRKACKYYNRVQQPEKYISSIEAVDGSEECVCISVSSHDKLYITDGFNLTHNTSQCLVLAGNYMSVMPKSKTIFIKAEGRFSEDMQKRSGMKYTEDPANWDYGTVFIFKCNVFEVIADTIISLVKSMYDNGEHLCIIIDSMDGLILQDDLNKKIGENAKVAGVPLLTKLLFRHLALPIESYNALMLITGQYSAEIKLDQYAQNTPRAGSSSGGSSVGHQSSVILEYSPRYGGDYILEDDKEKPDPVKNKVLGVYATLEVKKSMNEATGLGKIRIPIKRGVIGPAIWKEKEVSDMLLMHNLIIKKGAWLDINADLLAKMAADGVEFQEKHNGINKLNQYLEENPKVVNYLFDMFVKTLEV
ncbi:MAG: hypothetical protein EKK57_00350, partial [Proteobacteria bacterium]